MSLQTYVFIAQDDLPAVDKLQQAIFDAGFALTLPTDLIVSAAELCCVNAHFEGLESDFDYVSVKFDPNDWTSLPKSIGIPPHTRQVAMFNTNSNAQEIVGMMIMASSLCRLTNSVLYSEFFADDLVQVPELDTFVTAIVNEARAQFSGCSKLREK